MDPSLMEHLGLRYLKVANVLRTKILEGVYQPGERLPRQHDLTKEHNVAFTTTEASPWIFWSGKGTWTAKLAMVPMQPSRRSTLLEPS